MDDPLSLNYWARLAMALLCGGAIGLERQLRGKPAGIRTSVLVLLGSMTFMRLGIHLDGRAGDPARTLGQIVTGIGFLGGGVILSKDGLVKGMTSAAVIWILAGIGAAIAVDAFFEATVLTTIVLLVLVSIEQLERRFRLVLKRGVHGDESGDASQTAKE